MNRLRRGIAGLLCVAASLCIVGGCGPPERPVEEDTTNPKAETVGETAAEGSKSPAKRPAAEAVNGEAAKSADRTALPQAPDEAVRAVLQGIRENNPRAVWEFLPAGYQRDVNDLVHEFADRMDPELWNGVFTSLKKLVRLLKTQKRWILSHPKLNAAETINVDELEANWGGLVGLLETLAESEISDVRQMKKLDVGELLQTTGGRLMEQLAALSRLHPEDPFEQDVTRRLAEIEVTVVSSDGETARVRLRAPDSDEPPQEFDFVKIEGKWIPRPLAEQWETNIAQAKAKLAQLTPERVAQLKGRMLPALHGFNATVDQLQGAKTQAEFDMVVQQQVYPLVEQFLAAFPAPAAEPGEVEDAPTRSKGGGTSGPVTVIVRGRLDADGEERLSRLLGNRSNDPGNEILIGPVVTGDRMEYRLLPVGDLDEFVEKLDFAEVVEVDREGRTVTIELRRPLQEPDGGS